MISKNKINLNKLKKINEKFFAWKHNTKFQKKNEMIDKIISNSASTKLKSSLFINLLKNKHEQKINKEVKKIIFKKEKIQNEITNKLKFEVTR